jgi:hypothetical protein
MGKTDMKNRVQLIQMGHFRKLNMKNRVYGFAKQLPHIHSLPIAFTLTIKHNTVSARYPASRPNMVPRSGIFFLPVERMRKVLGELKIF